MKSKTRLHLPLTLKTYQELKKAFILPYGKEVVNKPVKFHNYIAIATIHKHIQNLNIPNYIDT